ncbi:uncharacterized protein [Chiloscyllium punctatum]|uniref:uncharacterized protein n=1 Tax=Chiloscyllium punctatum TaxID=137246 RepID=UPI003B63919C
MVATGARLTNKCSEIRYFRRDSKLLTRANITATLREDSFERSLNKATKLPFPDRLPVPVQKSQSACGGSDSPTPGYGEDNNLFCEPVEELDRLINFVEPVQEQNGPVKVDGRVVKQHGPIRAVEPRQDTSQEETVKRPFSIPTSDECIRLATCVNQDWKMIGRKLGLTDNDICIINTDYNIEGLKEKAYQMFQKWIQKQGKHATRQALFETLKMMDRSDVAMQLLNDTVTES